MGTKRDSDISTSIAPSDGAEESASDSHEHDLALLDQLTEEKMLLRKLDRRILPITCLLYLFACESVVSPETISHPSLLTHVSSPRSIELRKCTPARIAGRCSWR